MKIRRFIAALLFAGMLVPNASFAMDERVEQLKQRLQDFRKATKCALTKEGCTSEEATRIRVIFVSLAALLAATAYGVGRYFRRGPKVPPTQGVPQPTPPASVLMMGKDIPEYMRPKDIPTEMYTTPTKQEDMLAARFQDAMQNPRKYREALGALQQGLVLTFDMVGQLANLKNKLSESDAKKFREGLYHLWWNKKISYADQSAEKALDIFFNYEI